MSPGISESLAEVPGGRVFVRRFSAPGVNRPPIILLHDSLGSVEQWRDFPAALSDATGREVIAYDRLGFGRSAARTRLPSVHFVREEAQGYFPALQRALGITDFVLFGHSVGGAMALSIAAVNGGCRAVVTEAAQAFVEPRTLSGIEEAKKQFEQPGQFDRLVRWHGEKARWVLDAWTSVWLSPQFAAWSLDEELARVRCPVLAIHGDKDEFGSVEFPRRIAAGVKGPSQLALLAGCGHVPHRERKEEVLRLCASFLEQNVPG
jgi:pimeloyl-ACP methyl ester carboxylesterase